LRRFREASLCYLLLLLIALLGCQKNEADKGKVIAVVGDEQLTVDDLLEDIPVQIRSNLTVQEVREFVLKWINNEVLYQESLSLKMDEREDLQRQFETLRKQLLINELIQQTLADRVVLTEVELQEYYENNKDAYILEDDIIHAHHILSNTRAEANQVRRRLLAGESAEAIMMATLSDSTDQGPYSADWDWGYFSESDIIAEVPEISKAVFKLKAGDVSTPIKSDYGYHVLKIIDKQLKGTYKNFDLVKDEVQLTLQTKKKQDRYQRFLLQIKSKFKIETNFQILESTVLDSLSTGAE
jgi:parvulin-like peptidyl-prolyl isomerase